MLPADRVDILPATEEPSEESNFLRLGGTAGDRLGQRRIQEMQLHGEGAGRGGRIGQRLQALVLLAQSLVLRAETGGFLLRTAKLGLEGLDVLHECSDQRLQPIGKRITAGQTDKS